MSSRLDRFATRIVYHATGVIVATAMLCGPLYAGTGNEGRHPSPDVSGYLLLVLAIVAPVVLLRRPLDRFARALIIIGPGICGGSTGLFLLSRSAPGIAWLGNSMALVAVLSLQVWVILAIVSGWKLIRRRSSRS